MAACEPGDKTVGVDVTSFATGRFQSVRWVAQTGSTNADLMGQVLAAPAEPQVLFTDEQTAGRGRHQRSWTMRSGGGVMVSFYVPWSDAATAHAVNTALAVAAVEAIVEITGVHVALKWPNDVVVQEGSESIRKLAGILAELVTDGDEVRGVIAGLGLNVSWPTESDIAAAPEELGGAIALHDVVGNSVDREQLGASIVSHFDDALSHLVRDGTGALHSRYTSLCSTIGREVRIQGARESFTGRAVGIDEAGALIVDVDGLQRSVLAGDVVHVRNAAP